MKAQHAFLTGIVIVVISGIVSQIQGDPMLFRRINEWVFFIALVLAAIIFLFSGGNTPSQVRKRELQSVFKSTNARVGDMTALLNKDLDELGFSPEAKRKSPEELKAERKEGMTILRNVLLVALPSLLAVLIQHYYF